MLSLITSKFPFFSKGEVSVKNVHYPSLYQVYLLLKRDAYKIGKRAVCLFNFFKIFNTCSQVKLYNLFVKNVSLKMSNTQEENTTLNGQYYL